MTSSTTGSSNLQQFGETLTATGNLNGNANRAQGTLIALSGGIVSAASLNLGRTGLSINAEPIIGSATDGLYILTADRWHCPAR